MVDPVGCLVKVSSESAEYVDPPCGGLAMSTWQVSGRAGQVEVVRPVGMPGMALEKVASFK
ncbi:hypothetical protein ABZS66_43765 [Dactylosporangium sp. NPDC005572]|uniref:hypothetical protein n=1 Tax=Dactylosporangium sp. NPDC005572 TaxID=3156889 RepID=UPI0033AECAE4